LRSDYVYGRIEGLASGSTNQVELTLRMALSQVVPLAPLAEQHRIVAKVGESMALCDELEAAQIEREKRRDRLTCTTLARLTSSDSEERREAGRLYLSHGSSLITTPAEIPRLRDAVRKLAVRGELGDLTVEDDWAETTLGAVGRWGSGGTPSRSHPEYFGGPIPWVIIGDLNDDIVNETAETITELGLASSSAKLVPRGTLLIAMYGSVGKLGIAGTECATNQAIAHCIHDPSLVEADYLFLLLRSLRTSLFQSSRGGAQQNISQKILKSWPVRLPPLGAQRRIVANVRELMRVCDELERGLIEIETCGAQFLEAAMHEALQGKFGAGRSPMSQSDRQIESVGR
jgi:restriction endonuclease S subunit